ncbi:MAG: peptidase U32, partial [Actinobacteria bacterium HGW-Actinobacteria-9]
MVSTPSSAAEPCSAAPSYHTPVAAHIPELLAPAGGPAALRAAVNNGADAVYLGVEQLNARRGAENFTLDGLAEVTRFAHVRGARIYLTANVMILAHEMSGALDMIDRAWVQGVDAVIVQDLGLMRLLRQEMPHVRMHASTQIGTHNSATVEMLRDLGVSRVTLARETSLSEIAVLSAIPGIEVESFVHGALCISYSGQCLMSSSIGGRSANRGLCAQPCRLQYELLDEKGSTRKTPGGAHLLSPRDLAGVTELPALVRSGLSALKIEGRMKSPEYVALVTGVYREALDRAAADPDGFEVTPAQESVLAEAFSRGFSTAYLTGERGNDMMSYARPNNRGILIGRVARMEGSEAVIALDQALDGDDTIEFWTGRGRFAQKAGALRHKGRRVAVGPAGEKVALVPERAVGPGDRVFRVVNARLEQAAQRTFSETATEGTLPVDVSVRLVTGEPLTVTLTAPDGCEGSSQGPVVETARTKPVTAEEIAEHVGRLGGTAFRAASWDIELAPGAGIGFSALHRVRREAAQELEAAIVRPWNGRTLTGPVASAPRRRVKPAEVPEIVVRTDNISIARACLAAGAQRAVVPTWVIDSAEGELPRGIVPELPRVAHDIEISDLRAGAGGFDRAVVGNVGLIAATASEGRMVEAHWGMNAANPWTIGTLADLGAGFVWLSPELSGRQIGAIAESAALPFGVALYGRQETMVMEHCVLMALGECNQMCGTCGRRTGWFALRDAKGYSFPVMTDIMGRSHVFNSVPLDLTRALPELIEAGVAAVRLDFTVERFQQAQKITRLVREAVVAAVAG